MIPKRLRSRNARGPFLMAVALRIPFIHTKARHTGRWKRLRMVYITHSDAYNMKDRVWWLNLGMPRVVLV